MPARPRGMAGGEEPGVREDRRRGGLGGVVATRGLVVARKGRMAALVEGAEMRLGGVVAMAEMVVTDLGPPVAGEVLARLVKVAVH